MVYLFESDFSEADTIANNLSAKQLIALQLSFTIVFRLAFAIQAGDVASSYIPCQGRQDIPGRILVVSV